MNMSNSKYQPLLELEAYNNNESSLEESNTSFLKTVFNGINVILGNGVLIVSYALAHGGWLSLILFIGIAVVANYTSLLLKRCMEVDPRIKTYSHIGECAFGSVGKVIVSIVLYAELYMGTTSYLILEGDNLQKLFPGFSIGIPIDGKSCFLIIIALILLPTVLLDSLSILAYISAAGVLSSLLIFGSVLWVGVFDGIGFHQDGDHVHVPLFNWKGVPTAISLYMFCYGGQTVIPTLYTSMRKKQHFATAIFMSFTFSTIIYVLMAVLGCLMFGSSVESQITLNLPTRKLSSKLAIYTTLVTPLVKYALVLKPVVISTESWFPSHYRTSRWFNYIIRLTLVVTQVAIALAFPFFGYLMSLTGALLCAVAELTIPCLCYLKISSANSKPRLVECFFIWGIVCLSLVLSIFGTYTSLVDILVEITR